MQAVDNGIEETAYDKTKDKKYNNHENKISFLARKLKINRMAIAAPLENK
jgi:hypothetical protein